MNGKTYELFRFTHPDGSAKEWGYAEMGTGSGLFEVRWGKAGHLVQNQLGTEIPPEELVSLGSKRICNPEALKEFTRIKKTGERACLRVGTRFLGGYAVPNCHAESLADKLALVKAEFDTEIGHFLSDYDQALEAWISSLPAWEEPIRRAIEPVNVVGGRLRFGFQLVQVAPADQPGTLEEEVNGLGDGIFAEVEQMAKDLDESFEGKEKLHRRALGTFRRIREKLACLAFIDQRIAPVVDTLDDWFARIPPEGPIEGPIFNEGMGLALLLGDSQRMARHGAGQRAMQNGETVPEHKGPADRCRCLRAEIRREGAGRGNPGLYGWHDHPYPRDPGRAGGQDAGLGLPDP